MSPQDTEPDVPAETDEQDGTAEQELGRLTVEDDPAGTVNPSELAGTASDDDEDVR